MDCRRVPITMMMNMERRHGEMKPVIQKALVKLDGAPFKAFAAQRDRWAMETDYVLSRPYPVLRSYRSLRPGYEDFAAGAG